MEKSWGYYSIDKILIKCEIWSLKVPQCFVGLWCFPIDLAIGVCISQGPLLRAFVTLLKATTTSKLLCSGTCTIPKLYFTNSQHQDHWSGLKRPNSFGINNLKQLICSRTSIGDRKDGVCLPMSLDSQNTVALPCLTQTVEHFVVLQVLY